MWRISSALLYYGKMRGGIDEFYLSPFVHYRRPKKLASLPQEDNPRAIRALATSPNSTPTPISIPSWDQVSRHVAELSISKSGSLVSNQRVMAASPKLFITSAVVAITSSLLPFSRWVCLVFTDFSAFVWTLSPFSIMPMCLRFAASSAFILALPPSSTWVCLVSAASPAVVSVLFGFGWG